MQQGTEANSEAQRSTTPPPASGWLRPMVYFLGPVPVATLLLFLYWSLTRNRFPGLDDLLGLSQVLMMGYLLMGVASMAFVVAMSAIDGRGVTRASRYVLATLAGGALGATLGLYFPNALLLGAGLGAPSGLLTALLADFLAARSTPSGGRP